MKLNNNTDYWIKQELLDEDRLDSYYYSKEFIDFEKHISKIGIKTKKVNEMYKVLDGEHGSVEYVSNGVAFLRAQNIMDGYIDYENLVYISENQHKKSKRSMIYKEDLLLSVMASTGVSAIFSKNILCNANRAVGILRNSNKNFIDNHYFVALINSNIGKKIFDRGVRGSIQKRLNLSDINDLNIPIPSPEIQKYIGDKVRKSEELIEEAKGNENQACKEFNNLFDFKMNKNNVWYLNPDNLLDRIDCEYNFNYFFELEKNLSKQGLQVLQFGELIAKKMSEPQTDSSNFVDDGIPVLRITDIHEDYLDFLNCAKIPEEIYNDLKEFQIVPNDIIFGLSGTVGRTIVVPTEIPEKAITNRRIAKVTLKEPELAYYIAMFLNSDYGKIQLIRETTGGVQKNLRLEDIARIHIPIPNKEIISKISNYINNRMKCLNTSRLLIQQAKQDIEDLIEGNFDMSKIKETS